MGDVQTRADEANEIRIVAYDRGVRAYGFVLNHIPVWHKSEPVFVIEDCADGQPRTQVGHTPGAGEFRVHYTIGYAEFSAEDDGKRFWVKYIKQVAYCGRLSK